MSINAEKIEEYPDVDELDNLSKEDLRDKAVKEFNIDDERLKEEIEKDPMFSKDTADAMANMGHFAERFENTLRGKELVKKAENEETYKQTGKALAGNNFIRITTSLLNSFGNHAMLLSGKNDKEFFTQFEGIYFKVSDLIMNRETNIDASSIPAIINDFKYTFWNIGDILQKTGKNMDKYFDKLNDLNREVDKKANDFLGEK